MRQVQPLDGGGFAERPFKAPITETENTRVAQLGPFIQDNPGATQSATAMLLSGLAQHNTRIAGRAGSIIGLAVRSNADLTAGSATFRATIGGTAVGDAAVLSDLVQLKVVEFTTPVDFLATDLLSVTLATDSSYAPTTADHQAHLLVRWAPS